jgi:hypothetical protein
MPTSSENRSMARRASSHQRPSRAPRKCAGGLHATLQSTADQTLPIPCHTGSPTVHCLRSHYDHPGSLGPIHFVDLRRSLPHASRSESLPGPSIFEASTRAEATTFDRALLDAILGSSNRSSSVPPCATFKPAASRRYGSRRVATPDILCGLGSISVQ